MTPIAERRTGFLREFRVGAQQRAKQEAGARERTGQGEEEGCLYFREGVLSFTPGPMIGNQLVGASVVDVC